MSSSNDGPWDAAAISAVVVFGLTLILGTLSLIKARPRNNSSSSGLTSSTTPFSGSWSCGSIRASVTGQALSSQDSWLYFHYLCLVLFVLVDVFLFAALASDSYSVINTESSSEGSSTSSSVFYGIGGYRSARTGRETAYTTCSSISDINSQAICGIQQAMRVFTIVLGVVALILALTFTVGFAGKVSRQRKVLVLTALDPSFTPAPVLPLSRFYSSLPLFSFICLFSGWWCWNADHILIADTVASTTDYTQTATFDVSWALEVVCLVIQCGLLFLLSFPFICQLSAVPPKPQLVMNTNPGLAYTYVNGQQYPGVGGTAGGVLPLSAYQLWTCPICRASNPMGNQICMNCGQQTNSVAINIRPSIASPSSLPYSTNTIASTSTTPSPNKFGNSNFYHEISRIMNISSYEQLYPILSGLSTDDGDLYRVVLQGMEAEPVSTSTLCHTVNVFYLGVMRRFIQQYHNARSEGAKQAAIQQALREMDEGSLVADSVSNHTANHNQSMAQWILIAYLLLLHSQEGQSKAQHRLPREDETIDPYA